MQAIKLQNSQQPANNLLNRYTLFLKLDLSFVDLQLPKYWPGLSCELHFSTFCPSREMMNAFCHIFSCKFRKMQFFIAEKDVSNVFQLSRKAAVNFCKPAVRMKKFSLGV